jgi:hypothetical protein
MREVQEIASHLIDAWLETNPLSPTGRAAIMFAVLATFIIVYLILILKSLIVSSGPC